MIERIVAGLVCGALVAGLLELAGWQWRTRRPAAAEASTPPSTEAGHDTRATGRTITRLLLASVIGFFLGGTTAGIMEAMGHDEITFMSVLANTLIAFWTVLVWLFLSRRDRARTAKR